MVINNQRPGVYSRYDLSSTYLTPRSAGCAAVVAVASGNPAVKIYTLTSWQAAMETFSPDSDDACMLGCIRILFACGVSVVHAVPVAAGGYAAALDLVRAVDGVGAVICDAGDAATLGLLRDSVDGSALEQRERMAFCGCDDAAEAADIARAVNGERVVLCAPSCDGRAVFGACALAGAVLAADDCGVNWNGAALPQLKTVERLSEHDVQELLRAGVCVLEESGGEIVCIRAVTTSTMRGMVEDRSLSSINTMLIIDTVMQGVRRRLEQLVRASRVGGASPRTVESQAMVELAQHRAQGVIVDFDAPRARVDDAEPGLCLVELSFSVAHVLSRILVTASISI